MTSLILRGIFASSNTIVFILLTSSSFNYKNLKLIGTKLGSSILTISSESYYKNLASSGTFLYSNFSRSSISNYMSYATLTSYSSSDPYSSWALSVCSSSSWDDSSPSYSCSSYYSDGFSVTSSSESSESFIWIKSCSIGLKSSSS